MTTPGSEDPHDEEAVALLSCHRDLFQTSTQLSVIEIPTELGYCDESLALTLTEPNCGLGHLFSPTEVPLGHGANYAKLGRRAIFVNVQALLKNPAGNEGVIKLFKIKLLPFEGCFLL